jgi:TPR repeat protein
MMVAVSTGGGILMNKSMIAHSFELPADQRHAQPRFSYHCMLFESDGVLMNKSLAAHYFPLSTVQGDSRAQYQYGLILAKSESFWMNN